jgi:hypothetical protein
MRTAVLAIPVLVAVAAPGLAQDDALVAKVSADDLRRLALRLDKDATDASAKKNGRTYEIKLAGELGFITIEGKDDDALRVWSRLRENTTLRVVNTWNRDKLFGRVYLDTDDSVVVETLVLLRGGVSNRHVRASIDQHFETVRSFKEFVRSP